MYILTRQDTWGRAASTLCRASMGYWTSVHRLINLILTSLQVETSATNFLWRSGGGDLGLHIV